MPHAEAQNLLTLYPVMGALPALLARLQWLQVPAGTPLFREHAACQGFPMVLRGEVRVLRSASAGLFASQPLTAHGVTTTDTTLTLLSPPDFETAMADARFRGFVLGLFAQRMADLTCLIEAVAFRRLDSRLAATLLGHGQQVRATHQALADELGTVREIVTRLLHRFERNGWVQLSRECITLCDSAALRHLAAVQTR
jgi:CRP/FNR family transcriptional regulator, anaerobic regulatory protein